ncbi:MAG: rhomboid family intramembrane serine protease, partial [Calditrichaeota bacterium]|nr:rhomboid family intramembrane serine protease [Calditrichota bacterium]
PIFFRLRALWLLGFWMALEFYQALSASPGDYVAHWAHIGGFLIGALWTVGQRSSRWLKN